MVYEDMTVSQTHFAYNNHNLGSNEKYKYSNWSLIFGTISSVSVAIQHAHVLPPRWDKGALSQFSASIVGMIFSFTYSVGLAASKNSFSSFLLEMQILDYGHLAYCCNGDHGVSLHV